MPVVINENNMLLVKIRKRIDLAHGGYITLCGSPLKKTVQRLCTAVDCGVSAQTQKNRQEDNTVRTVEYAD